MKRTFCVFNRTRESFLCLRAVASGALQNRLLGLLGHRKLAAEDGIWLLPARSAHTRGMPFPVDLVYLDQDNRVIHLVEHLDPFRRSPVDRRCASILELKTRSIYSSHTQVGDELLICPPEEMERYWKRGAASPVSSQGGG